MAGSAKSLRLDGHTLTLADVRHVALTPHIRLSLAPTARKAVQQSRGVIEAVLKTGKPVYGVNTGFGDLSRVRVPAGQLGQLQLNLVRSHAVGTGPALDEPTTRAMMLLRANTLAKGFSGVRPVVIETLLALLNAGVHPVIPSQGSLGASGDLAPLAHMALVLLGEGKAVYQGKSLAGKTALAKAGIAPLTLEAKEGLALLNGTQMMTALGTLTLLGAEQLLNAADIAGAMTIEAVMGSHQPFDSRVAELRPHPGHAETARIFRALLADSAIARAHTDCDKVQDAYSLRCIPQIHGAVRDAVKQIRTVLETEINAVTDNPLIFPNGDILSQGNFHGEPLAIALDMLGIALSELASASERRIDKLMNPAFSGLPSFLVPEGQAGLNSGMMIAHYTTAALVSENKSLAHPASVDSIPTSNDKEDHVSMGAIAARQAQSILTNARHVIATELLCAAQGLEERKPLRPGVGVAAAHRLIRRHVKPLATDRSLQEDIDSIVSLIRDGSLLDHVGQVVCPHHPAQSGKAGKTR
ncbi:MAG: histidine ammonia-lyase [Candidatus Melainabacteria bacterium]